MRDLTEDTFETFVAGSGIRLVLFGAQDCGPARKQRRELEQLHERRAELAAIDGLVHDEPRRKHGVRRLPTTVLFHNGSVMHVFAGFQPASRIEAFMRACSDQASAISTR